MSILRMFEWATGSEKTSWFTLDQADLLTMKHDIRIKNEHVSTGSELIEGLDWMGKDKSES